MELVLQTVQLILTPSEHIGTLVFEISFLYGEKVLETQLVFIEKKC